MSSELVERLRGVSAGPGGLTGILTLARQAADRIEALEVMLDEATTDHSHVLALAAELRMERGVAVRAMVDGMVQIEDTANERDAALAKWDFWRAIADQCASALGHLVEEWGGDHYFPPLRTQDALAAYRAAVHESVEIKVDGRNLDLTDPNPSSTQTRER